MRVCAGPHAYAYRSCKKQRRGVSGRKGSRALPDEDEEGDDAMFGATGTGPVDVAEVQDNAAFEEVCLKGSGLCVMAVLDPQSPSFDNHLGEVKTVAGRWSKQPLRFFWVNGPRQVRFPLLIGVDRHLFSPPTYLCLVYLRHGSHGGGLQEFTCNTLGWGVHLLLWLSLCHSAILDGCHACVLIHCVPVPVCNSRDFPVGDDGSRHTCHG